MRFRFNDKKTAQAAAHLLRLHGGSMEYLKLIKLMYLADRKMLVEHGITITGDTMKSMKHGPVLSNVFDLISVGQAHLDSEWFQLITPPTNYKVSLRPETGGAPKNDELSEFEMDLLKDLHERYGAMDQWKLVEHLHKELPEWKDPGESSSIISPVDILRAEDRTPEEIERVKRTADDIWFLGAPT